MVTTSQVVGLTLASILLIAVPGPSVLFVVGRALSEGRRTALLSVVGNGLGSYAAAVAVACGLGPLLQRSDLLFTAVKLAGAAYLVWLGVHAIATSGAATRLSAPEGAPRGAWRAVRAGVMVGVTNPKIFILFAAVLPPFVDRSSGSVLGQMLLLAVVPVAVGLVTDTAWGLAAGHARTWLSRTATRMRTVRRVGGLSMVGLGVSVAVTGRPD